MVVARDSVTDIKYAHANGKPYLDVWGDHEYVECVDYVTTLWYV